MMKPVVQSKKSSSVLVSTALLLTIVLFVFYSASNMESIRNELFHPVEIPASEKDVVEIKKQLSKDSILSHSKTANSVGTTIAPHAADFVVYKHHKTHPPLGGEGSGLGNKAKISSRLVSESVVSPKKEQDELQLASAFNVIMNTSPVVIFIRSGHTDSDYLKKLLTSEYEVTPPLAVVDLDKHENGKKLQEYIMLRKLATYNTNFEMFDDIPDVPYLFVNGVSVINTSLEKDIKSLNANGLLEGKLQALAGKTVNFSKVTPPSNS